MIETWKKVHGPELATLGALTLRRYLLARELADVDRQIEQSRETLIALERTKTLAQQAQSEGRSTSNGHNEGPSAQGA